MEQRSGRATVISSQTASRHQWSSNPVEQRSIASGTKSSQSAKSSLTEWTPNRAEITSSGVEVQLKRRSCISKGVHTPHGSRHTHSRIQHTHTHTRMHQRFHARNTHQALIREPSLPDTKRLRAQWVHPTRVSAGGHRPQRLTAKQPMIHTWGRIQ